MILKGHLWKEGKFWLITVPDLDILTQATGRKKAFRMIADAIEILVHKKGFQVKLLELSRNEFFIQSNDHAEMVALFLKRQREMHDLTVRDVTQKLGYSSPNAYAQYETGKHLPSLDKITDFLSVINPKANILLGVF